MLFINLKLILKKIDFFKKIAEKVETFESPENEDDGKRIPKEELAKLSLEERAIKELMAGECHFIRKLQTL